MLCTESQAMCSCPPEQWHQWLVHQPAGSDGHQPARAACAACSACPPQLLHPDRQLHGSHLPVHVMQLHPHAVASERAHSRMCSSSEQPSSPSGSACQALLVDRHLELRAADLLQDCSTARCSWGSMVQSTNCSQRHHELTACGLARPRYTAHAMQVPRPYLSIRPGHPFVFCHSGQAKSEGPALWLCRAGSDKRARPSTESSIDALSSLLDCADQSLSGKYSAVSSGSPCCIHSQLACSSCRASPEADPLSITSSSTARNCGSSIKRCRLRAEQVDALAAPSQKAMSLLTF